MPLQNARRTLQWGGVRGVRKICDFRRNRPLPRKRYERGPWLLWIMDLYYEGTWLCKAGREGSTQISQDTLVSLDLEQPNSAGYLRGVFLQSQGRSLSQGADPSAAFSGTRLLQGMTSRNQILHGNQTRRKVDLSYPAMAKNCCDMTANAQCVCDS